jgi:AraC-like DNA-binding protein
MQAAVERAIQVMWHRYHEPLTLAELADSAILSRFYFSRVFRTVTGTSPGRFLTAIRLYKAKHLLLETSLSVTDISYRVGYNSLGTFTSRFTRSVGMSPARYRYLSRVGIPPVPFAGPAVQHSTGTVHGSLRFPEIATRTRVYVATFDSPIPQGMPVACDVVDYTRPYQLSGVPSGEWFVHAAAVALGDVDPRPSRRRPLFVNSGAAVYVPAGGKIEVNIDLHPTGPIDLPILLALPELDSQQIPDDLQIPEVVH